MYEELLHGSSGSVALPRVNATLAGLIVLDVEERLRRADRVVVERRRDEDMLIGWYRWWSSFRANLGHQLVSIRDVDELKMK